MAGGPARLSPEEIAALVAEARRSQERMREMVARRRREQDGTRPDGRAGED